VDCDPVAAARDKAHFLLSFRGRQMKAEVCDCLAFSALTLLVGRQEEHPARKN